MSDTEFDILAAVSRKGEESRIHVKRSTSGALTMFVGDERYGWCEFKTKQLAELHEILDQRYGDGRMPYEPELKITTRTNDIDLANDGYGR